LAWTEFGGNGLNMGLDRNFFSDGKGNHRISGIQSVPSKTGLIDSSSFVLKKRLARADIGGQECITRLALNIVRRVGGPCGFKCLNALILISAIQFYFFKSCTFSQSMPSRDAANQDTVTGGNRQNQDTLTVPELESNGNCYAWEKFPTTR